MSHNRGEVISNPRNFYGKTIFVNHRTLLTPHLCNAVRNSLGVVQKSLENQKNQQGQYAMYSEPNAIYCAKMSATIKGCQYYCCPY